jgi:hypothetical protein
MEYVYRGLVSVLDFQATNFGGKKAESGIRQTQP